MIVSLKKFIRKSSLNSNCTKIALLLVKMKQESKIKKLSQILHDKL